MSVLGRASVLVREAAGLSKWVPAADIKVGDILVGETEDNPVEQINISTHTHDVYGFEHEAPFFTDTTAFKAGLNWVAMMPDIASLDLAGENAKQLEKGQEIKTLRAGKVIEGIKPHKLDLPLKRYDFRVGGDHTLYVEGYLAHNKSGGGTTTSVSGPPAWLRPQVEGLVDKANTAYDQTSKTPYGGQLISLPNANQLQAQTKALNVANGPNAANLGNQFRNAGQIAQNQLSSGYLNQLNDTQFNPTNADTSGVIQAAINPLRQDLMNNIIPSIQSQAIASGAYGGSRQGMQELTALDNFNRQAIDTAATINYQDLARRDELALTDLTNRREAIPKTALVEQNLMSLAPSLNAQGFQADLIPADIQSSVGAEQQMQQQDTLDEAYQQYLMAQQAPWQGMSELASMIYGVPGGVSSSSGSQGTALSRALMGGLGGMSLASGLSGIAGLGGLASTGGTAGGALLGALFGLSDRRLKEDITPIGKLDNGLTIYKFRYKGSNEITIGLMADEVKEVKPEAVTEHGPHKIQTVDYNLAVQ